MKLNQILTEMNFSSNNKEMASWIRNLMKSAFEAGYKAGEYESSHIDWERSPGSYPNEPKSLNFKSYFKNKFT